MLEIDAVRREAEEIARKNFGTDKVVRTIVEPMIDQDGDDALRVTIVLRSEAVDHITGDTALDNLVQIHGRLWAQGEERLPFVEFATEEELAESDDSES